MLAPPSAATKVCILEELLKNTGIQYNSSDLNQKNGTTRLSNSFYTIAAVEQDANTSALYNEAQVPQLNQYTSDINTPLISTQFNLPSEFPLSPLPDAESTFVALDNYTCQKSILDISDFRPKIPVKIDEDLTDFSWLPVTPPHSISPIESEILQAFSEPLVKVSEYTAQSKVKNCKENIPNQSSQRQRRVVKQNLYGCAGNGGDEKPKLKRQSPIKRGDKKPELKRQSPIKRRRRQGPKCPEFILAGLNDSRLRDVISYEDETQQTFRIRKPDVLTELWATAKKSRSVKYVNFARTIRHYYDRGVFGDVRGQHFVYKVGPELQKYNKSDFCFTLDDILSHDR